MSRRRRTRKGRLEARLRPNLKVPASSTLRDLARRFQVALARDDGADHHNEKGAEL
jgi:hypothetical protein